MPYITLGKNHVLQSRVREIRQHGSFRGFKMNLLTLKGLL